MIISLKLRTVAFAALLALVSLSIATPAVAQNTNPGSIVMWGLNDYGQCNVPPLPAGLGYTRVAAEGWHTVALRSDGSAVAWGLNNYGQTNVPALPAGLSYTQVAAGVSHTVALRSDGSVVAWGDNYYGQTTVPALPAGPSYMQVAAGYAHTVALRSDGSVVAWGWNGFGQTTVLALPAGLSYTQVAAGSYHTVALRSDGSVVAWGYNYLGLTTVPALPAGLSYTQVAAGTYDTVALRSDGSVVAWDYSGYGQTTVPAPPAGHSYTQVATGGNHAVALRSDGSAVAWGNNTYSQATVPVLPAGQSYTQVAAGADHTVALKRESIDINATILSTMGLPLVYSISTEPVAPSAFYLMDVSFAGTTPGMTVPLAAGGTGVIPLNAPYLYYEYGQTYSSIFTGFVGLLDATGQATAAFNTPPVAALAGLQLSAAAITLDASAPFGIGRVGSGVTSILALPTLAITSVTPNAATVGALITVVGTGFLPTAQLIVGGVPVTPMTHTLTQIVFAMPAMAACNGQVQLQLPTGQQASSAFNTTPLITAVLFNTGPSAGGAVFIIQGANFHVGTTVTVGGAPATIQAMTMTGILATTPAGTVGPATIVITSPSGCFTTATYTYL